MEGFISLDLIFIFIVSCNPSCYFFFDLPFLFLSGSFSIHYDLWRSVFVNNSFDISKPSQSCFICLLIVVLSHLIYYLHYICVYLLFSPLNGIFYLLFCSNPFLPQNFISLHRFYGLYFDSM